MSKPLRPLVLIRGFGGIDVDDEQANPYQGFNEGTVYPSRRGENYIYEGFVLRALKSGPYPYRDATNVVGFYSSELGAPAHLGALDQDSAQGTVVLDPGTEERVLAHGVAGTIWIYRFYDLRPRALDRYGEGLCRLVELIERSAHRHDEDFMGVDIVAHSMGGLVAREGVLEMEKAELGSARRKVHRIVTLGSPHRGISFQRVPQWLLRALPGVEDSGNEMASFDPTSTRFHNWADAFDMENVLTVVGTDYRSYGVAGASAMNRLASMFDGGSLGENRSDGLVKQSSAQLPGAPRAFVHKCHGGRDSLVASREAYEIAMRFFHGTHRAALSLREAKITRGRDFFGRSEFYFGVSIKPRFVDFDLFHQSAEAENCYGPFHTDDLTDDLPDLHHELLEPLATTGDRTTGWAGPDRLIWEGWIDGKRKPVRAQGLVFRIDFYLGERDSHGVGFSDNVAYRQQYYLQAFPTDTPEIFIHTGEQYLSADPSLNPEELRELAQGDGTHRIECAEPVPDEPYTWTFNIGGAGFEGRFQVSVTPAEEVRTSPAPR